MFFLLLLSLLLIVISINYKESFYVDSPNDIITGNQNITNYINHINSIDDYYHFNNNLLGKYFWNKSNNFIYDTHGNLLYINSKFIR